MSDVQSDVQQRIVYAFEREHPAHSAELVERIDALASYLGFGNYDPSSPDKRRRKRARRLWTEAYRMSIGVQI